jgi:hypothetical protein
MQETIRKPLDKTEGGKKHTDKAHTTDVRYFASIVGCAWTLAVQSITMCGFAFAKWTISRAMYSLSSRKYNRELPERNDRCIPNASAGGSGLAEVHRHVLKLADMAKDAVACRCHSR